MRPRITHTSMSAACEGAYGFVPLDNPQLADPSADGLAGIEGEVICFNRMAVLPLMIQMC